MLQDSATTGSAAFHRPNLAAPIDVEAYWRACPATATTRGTFFQFVAELVENERGGVPPELFAGVSGRRWVSWSNYALSDFLHLAVNAARLLHGDQPLGEGLRRIGWMAYPSFAATMAGRVVAYAFGDDADALMQALPKAYSVSLSSATTISRRIASGHWEIQMRDVYSFVNTYQLGVLEGAVRARGHTPDVRVRKCARLCDMDFDVRW